MAERRQLDRLHRVRTVQLTLARVDEARALDQQASEAALHARIAQLAGGVAPVAAEQAGFSLVAAAHYRERLHQSAAAAQARVRRADEAVERATQATREARRDQSAAEKLIARATADEAVRALRALEESPPARRARHDPC